VVGERLDSLDQVQVALLEIVRRNVFEVAAARLVVQQSEHEDVRLAGCVGGVVCEIRGGVFKHLLTSRSIHARILLNLAFIFYVLILIRLVSLPILLLRLI